MPADIASTDTPPDTSLSTSFDGAFPADDLDNPTPVIENKPPSDTPPVEDDDTGNGVVDKPGQGAAPASGTPGTPAAPAAPAANKDATKTDTDTTFEPPKVSKPSELRTWAQRMGSRAKTAETELKTVKARLAQVETEVGKAKSDPALVEELANTKKKLSEYEGELRLTRYERSQEYKEKYQAPVEQTWKRAQKLIGQLTVAVVDPENADIRTERPATAEDFKDIYAKPVGQAWKAAREMFGDAAPSVMEYVTLLKNQQEAAFEAIEQHRTQAEEYEAKQKAQQKQSVTARAAMFEQATKIHSGKNASLYEPRAEDPEGNTLLEKGTAFARSVFSGPGDLSPQQIAMRDAQAHNWIAAHPRLMRDLNKLRAELADAQKAIETLRSGGPGKPSGGGTVTPATGSGNIMDDFDKATQ